MTPEVEIIAEQVAERVRYYQREQNRASKLSTVLEAFSILKEIGEVELVEAFKNRSKSIGQKLNNK